MDVEVECIHKVIKRPRLQSTCARFVEVHLPNIAELIRDLDAEVPCPARLGGRIKLRKVQIHPRPVVSHGFVRERDCQVAWVGTRRRQSCGEDECRDVVGIPVLIHRDVARVGEILDVGDSFAHDGRTWTHSGPVAIQRIVWVPASHIYNLATLRWDHYIR